MAKSKSAPKAAPAPAKSGSDKVKSGRVTKPAEAPKVSKDLKTKIEKSDKKSSKKSKKAPTPPPESESESDSESDASSDSDVEEAKPVVANGTSKANGAKPKADASSESESESSESEADAAPAAKAFKPVAESSDESDSESESDADVPAKSGSTPAAAVVNGNKADASSDESGSDSDEESSEGSESEEEAAAAPPAKKRKADDTEAPAAKKSKTESAAGGIKNLFVGNLSWNVDEDWLKTEFEGFGEITGVRIITDRESGRSKGFGYVEFADAADAAKALEAKKGSMLDDRELNIDFSTPRDNSAGATRPERVNNRAGKFGDSASTPSDTLFVGNISFDATAEIMQETFEQYGTITRVTLPTDPESQALKGFGYVGFSSVDEAKAALEALNGADIAGRNIRLDFATPRADNGGGGGRGGGGRGGGFRGGRGGGDRGGRGGRGGFSRGGRGGGDRGGRGGRGGGRGGSTNRGGLGDFSGKKMTF